MNYPLWLHRLCQELHRLANHSRPVLYQGVDISEHNGYVDFNALKGKIDFAILRCGYGSDYISQDDSCFQRNAEACDAAGIPYGVYLYSYATDESMARNEAAHTLRLLRGRDPDFGVWYDIEDSCLPYGEGVAAQCKIYCDTLLAAGCTCVGIYAPLYLMEDYLSGPELKPYDKWVAQWNWTCDYPEPGIWQYTSEGVIGGQTFDMNYVYKDYPELTGGNMTQQKFDQMMENYLAGLAQRPASGWAKSAWDKACGEGIFDGSGPRSFLSREQAALVLERLKLL